MIVKVQFSGLYFWDMKEKLAERIRFTRLQLGLSQQNVADELNITVAAYSNIERGVTDINITRLYAISAILNTTPIDLLREQSMVAEPTETQYNGLSGQIGLLSQQLNVLQQQFIAMQNELNLLKAKK